MSIADICESSMYLKLASIASGLSRQNAIRPNEATDAISMNTKKLNMSPVRDIPIAPTVRRKYRET